jgi:hypothetical protein
LSAVDYLHKIKRQIAIGLRGHRSETHATPDTSNLVWKIANDAHDTEILLFKNDRDISRHEVPSVVDILREGEKKLRSSSLKTFNAKLSVLLHGQNAEHSLGIFDELDDIPHADFIREYVDNDD